MKAIESETRRVERITVTRVVMTRGTGIPTEDSPHREVVSYWLDSGEKLLEVDPCAPRTWQETPVDARALQMLVPPTLPERRTITCIAQASARGVEVVVSGMARIVDLQLLHSWARDIATGDSVCVTLDALNQIIAIAPSDD